MEKCQHRSRQEKILGTKQRIKKKMDRAKEDWWDECREIERLDDMGRSDQIKYTRK